MDGLYANRKRSAAGGRRRALAVGWCAALCVALAPIPALASAPDPGLPPAPQVGVPPASAPAEKPPIDESREDAGAREAASAALDETVAQTGPWVMLHDDEATEQALESSKAKAEAEAEAAESAKSAAVSDEEMRRIGAVSGGVLAATSGGGAAACFVIGWRRARTAHRDRSSQGRGSATARCADGLPKQRKQRTRTV